jgi:glycosyltransferase involved in cell wall biosynthesis
MKKVLVVSRGYSPLSGGAAVYIYNILKRTKEHEYLVLGNLAKLSFKNFIKNPKNVKAKYTNLTRIRYLNAALFITYSFFSSLRMKFDYIVGNELVGAISALMTHYVTRKPLVSIIHNVSYKGLLTPVRHGLLKMMFDASTVIVVNGPKLEQDIYDIFGESYRPKIRTMYPGVDVPKKYPKVKSPRKPVILFVGAIYGYKKGIEYIIQAFPDILKEVDSELWIAGSSKNPDFYQMLKDTAKELGVQDKVKFLGRVENVFSYFDVCDVFTLASYDESETFGIPCIEAGAMGKPIVVTDIFEKAGVVVDGKTGIVVPRKDPKAISKAVLKLLKDKKLRVKMGKNGRDHAKKFTWQRSADELENIINNI